jgi:hypothetical protein
MRKFIKILVLFYLIMNVSACKKDSVQQNLTISNLRFTPDRVTPGSTFTFQGSVDFLNAKGGVSQFRLTTSTGSDLTLSVPSNSQTSGTLSGTFEVSFPAIAGNFTFQVWIIDNGGNVSNKLQGSVQAVVDDEGKNWKTATSSWNLTKVIWANQSFMAVGYSGTIITSTDPLHSWTQRNSGTDSWLRGVAWSGTQYVVAGSYNTILSSPDGNTWTPRSSSGFDVWFSSVAWSTNGFLAVGFQYVPNRTAIFNSADGKTWSENTFSIEEASINAVIWANNQYVAVGRVNGGTANATPMILTSPDGFHWTDRSKSNHFGNGIDLRDVTWTGSNFVAVGEGLASTSADGITWNVNDNNFNTFPATGIVWTGRKLMATTKDGIYGSTDGLNWSLVYSMGYPMESITWSGFQYVSVGMPDLILVSPY